MSEPIAPVPEAVISASEALNPMSGGAMLRKGREAQGLHIGALAVALKVPVAKLEALESDRFDLLPDMVFVRALAASVCRTLKIDSTPILEQLPRTTVPLLKTDQAGINTPFRAAGDGLGLSFWHQLTKPFVLAVLALLVGIVVLVFFPFKPRIEIASAVQPTTEVPVMPLSMSPSSATEAAVPAAEAEKSSLASSLPTSSAMPTPGADAPAGALPASAANLAAAIVPGSGATTGLLSFTARGPSWIEVIDANGVVQVRKTLIDREVVGVSGALPLSVVVGRANTTELQVRGKPFDLTGIAKNNVARFEVK